MRRAYAAEARAATGGYAPRPMASATRNAWDRSADRRSQRALWTPVNRLQHRWFDRRRSRPRAVRAGSETLRGVVPNSACSTAWFRSATSRGHELFADLAAKRAARRSQRSPRSARSAPPPKGARDLGAARRSRRSPRSARSAPPPKGARDLGVARRSRWSSPRQRKTQSRYAA
jgi:hypothetical protein